MILLRVLLVLSYSGTLTDVVDRFNQLSAVEIVTPSVAPLIDFRSKLREVRELPKSKVVTLDVNS